MDIHATRFGYRHCLGLDGLGKLLVLEPKRDFDTAAFVVVSASLVLYYENTWKATKWVSLSSCVLSTITASSSFLILGLHAFR
jgi:hypothetical protein